MKNQVSETKILGTSFNSRIFELQQQILILNNDKTEGAEKLNCYISEAIQTKVKNRYTDTVKARYQNWVWMGAGTGNVGVVIKSILDNLINLEVDCFSQSTFV